MPVFKMTVIERYAAKVNDDAQSEEHARELSEEMPVEGVDIEWDSSERQIESVGP